MTLRQSILDKYACETNGVKDESMMNPNPIKPSFWAKYVSNKLTLEFFTHLIKVIHHNGSFWISHADIFDRNR